MTGPNNIKTPSGMNRDEITLDSVLNGTVRPEDFRITAAALKRQAEIAKQAGRLQLAENFLRAAELTAVPDEELVAMYNALRPGRSTEEELSQLALQLERDYAAPGNAELVRETAKVYGERGILRQDKA